MYAQGSVDQHLGFLVGRTLGATMTIPMSCIHCVEMKKSFHYWNKYYLMFLRSTTQGGHLNKTTKQHIHYRYREMAGLKGGKQAFPDSTCTPLSPVAIRAEERGNEFPFPKEQVVPPGCH
ncbi:hypothetical protein TNCV_3098021 [Trichonephila clavipes]|nr:hypothetical protein TNCV_3098021 [Trichonephila clavipes]